MNQISPGIEQEFARLVAIMDTLRSPGGCPWDAEQTHQSLVRYLIEESYEVVEAIEAPQGIDRQLLKEELGDVLLQVVFHARVAQETPAVEGGFSILEVLQGLNDKLERRHPHVFQSGQSSQSLAELEAGWEDLKKQEKPERTGVFDGIPPHLPALAFAEKAIAKAQKNKVDLLAQESADADQDAAWAAQIFELVQQAKASGIDPEKALRLYTKSLIANYQETA